MVKIPMKRIATLVLCTLALLVNCASAQGLKIGYIDSFRVETESAQAQRAMEALKKEFTPRQKRVEDMQKQIAAAQDQLSKTGDKMQPAERQTRERALADMMKQSDQARRALTEDVELRKSQEHAKILDEINIVIKGIAEAGKYDLILQQSIYSSNRIDITEQVLKEMAKRAAASR